MNSPLVSHRPADSRMKAFTLIELLAVIGILAVLAALIFPTVGRIWESGRCTVCVANLKQIAAGMQMYVNDHEGYFPPTSVWKDGVQTVWWFELAPYLGEKVTEAKSSPLICPSTYEAWEKDTGNTFSWPNYGMNIFMGSNPWGEVERPDGPIKAILVDSPGRKILVMDGDWNSGTPLASVELTKPDVHSGGRNILYVDGHVEKWIETGRLRQDPYGKNQKEDMWGPVDMWKP